MVNTLCRAHSEQGLLSYDVVRLGGGGGGGGRGGKSAKRKAVVAVARKLAVLLHVLGQRDVDFDPFYGRQPKTS